MENADGEALEVRYPGHRRGGRPKHQLHTMKRALLVLGKRALDQRSATAKALKRWKLDLISDLGGDVSTQQDAIIDLAVKTKFLLDSIDAWLFAQPSIVLKNRRALMPVVVQRQTLADALAKYLMALGLERKVKTQSLEDYIAEKYGTTEDEDSTTTKVTNVGDKGGKGEE